MYFQVKNLDDAFMRKNSVTYTCFKRFWLTSHTNRNDFKNNWYSELTFLDWSRLYLFALNGGLNLGHWVWLFTLKALIWFE